MGLLLDTLRTVEFLVGESDEAIDEFLVLGQCVDRERGHALWQRDAEPQGLVVPVTGEAKTVGHGPEGRSFVERFAGPGDWLGLQSTLDGLPHPVAAEVTRSGAFLKFPREAVLAYFDQHVSVRHKATQAVGRLYRQGLSDRESAALQTVPQRLAAFLLDHACLRHGDGAKVLTHATQGEIGARIGTVREVVARSLGEFAAQGLITRTAHGVFVDDWAGLSAVAGREAREAPRTSVAPAALRTARFYLPLRQDWAPAHEPAPSGCKEHLGDLSDCARAGCPSAAALQRAEEADARARVMKRRSG